MTTVIGICGAANAGKGTVASLFPNRIEISFADPLYAMLSAMTGHGVERLKDRRFKEEVVPWLGKSPRQLLQTLGTEWGRGMVRDDVWIVIGRRKIAGAIARLETLSSPSYVVIPDVRFDNEAQVIRDEFGGVVWEVVRPGAETCVSHSSEAGISRHLIDRTIRNDGSLAALEAAVRGSLNATLKDIRGSISSDRRTGCAP